MYDYKIFRDLLQVFNRGKSVAYFPWIGKARAPTLSEAWQSVCQAGRLQFSPVRKSLVSAGARSSRFPHQHISTLELAIREPETVELS